MSAAFCLSSVLYIAIMALEETNLLIVDHKLQVIAKCLPILLLILKVRKKFASLKEMKRNPHAYGVFIALCFSIVADALLVYGRDLRFFLAGLGLFLMAAISYMQAFGWKQLKIYILPITLITFTSMYYLVFQVLATVPIEIQIGCLVYTLVGQAAIWRALARVDWDDVNKGRYHDLFAAFGVLSFATSDFTLAMNKFCFPIQHSGFIVMFTYYLAQYAISSAVKNKKLKQ